MSYSQAIARLKFALGARFATGHPEMARATRGCVFSTVVTPDRCIETLIARMCAQTCSRQFSRNGILMENLA
jgi:hypothetical protein